MALMEYKGYHAQIEYDAQDQLFVGSVIGIRDTIGFHGTSVGELTDSFHRAIDNYLDLCEREGREPDKEYRGSINIRLTPELHRIAAIYSAQDHVSLNQFIVDAVQRKCSSRDRESTGLTAV